MHNIYIYTEKRMIIKQMPAALLIGKVQDFKILRRTGTNWGVEVG